MITTVSNTMMGFTLAMMGVSVAGMIYFFGAYIFVGIVALFAMCGAIGFINTRTNS